MHAKVGTSFYPRLDIYIISFNVCSLKLTVEVKVVWIRIILGLYLGFSKVRPAKLIGVLSEVKQVQLA